MAFADVIFDGQAELDGEVIGTFATDHPAQGLSKGGKQHEHNLTRADARGEPAGGSRRRSYGAAFQDAKADIFVGDGQAPHVAWS